MSSTNIDYQIVHYQGDTFVLQFNYLNDNDTAIDLAGCTGNMHIKRSPQSTKLICELTDDYPNGVFGISGSCGDFNVGSGKAGNTGGISLNYDGITGAVYISIDANTVSTIPAGRHFYDLEVVFPSDEVKTILNGTFELAREVSR
tara:strand:+ start:901 stop:1335 length:435 start_codon:yes stop_codon:yes gene_type:complete